MHLKSLDSVRGVAALIVVFYHSALVIPATYAEPDWLFRTPLRLLVSGPAAVVVFFVLSGVVLAKNMQVRDAGSYIPYIVNRIARIWAPFAIAIVLSAILGICLQAHVAQSASAWLNYTWRDSITPTMVAHHLLMDGKTDNLNNPMWSLIHEIRISFIFPFLVLVTRRSVLMALLLSLTLLAFSTFQLASGHGSSLIPYTATLAYIFLFVAGIAIALHLHYLQQLIGAAPTAFHAAGWVAGFTLILMAPAQVNNIATISDAAHLVLCGVGACLIVLLCLAEHRLPKMLAGSLPLFLCKISYSLYLTHVIVLAATIRILDGLVPIELSVGMAIILSVLLAIGFQRVFEARAAAWGKRLAQGIQRPVGTTPAV